MTTTPLATIADAVIEFILSLLRDPAAASEFEQDPEGTLAKNGLGDVCAADIRAVAPVVLDRDDVVARPPQTVVVTPPPPSGPSNPIVKEIQNISNNYHIDARSTIVDQSVNQNIWAEGDVMQIFDNEAVVASGDDAVAAGDDAQVDESTTDITAGDVNIGNTDSTTTINDSFNDSSTDTDIDVNTEAEDSFNDNSDTTDVDVTVDDSFQAEATTDVQTAVAVGGDATVVSEAAAPAEDFSAEAVDPVDEPALYEEPMALDVDPLLEPEYDEP